MKITFDGSDCWKCDGTGRVNFSYAGGVCFACSGAKRTLSRKGRAAKAKWNDFLAGRKTRSAAELHVGDRVYVRNQFAGFGGNGGQFASWTGTVLRVELGVVQTGVKWVVDGVEQPVPPQDHVVVSAPKRAWLGNEAGEYHLTEKSYQIVTTNDDITAFAAKHPKLSGYVVAE